MKPRDLTQYVVAGGMICLIVVLLFGQLFGQPFLVFVETGSMSPTLEPNDGFLAVPMVVAGEIEPGDVIVFDSQVLGGGELTTHRVVAVTSEGYLTQGDANPFLDQDGDEPPVASGQIRSVALQPGGDLVVVPGLGATVTAINDAVGGTADRVAAIVGVDAPNVATISTAVLVVGLLAYVVSTVRWASDRRARRRSDDSPLQNPLVLIALLTLVVIIPMNATMLLASGTYQYELISSTSPTDDERIVGVGESTDVTYAMRNGGYLPVVTILEPASDGVDPPEGFTYIPRQTTVETTVTMHAPDETGAYARFVRESRYLVVLPPSLIAWLHAIHPVAALGALNLTVAALVATISVATLGTDRIKLRSTRRDLTIGEQLRRWF